MSAHVGKSVWPRRSDNSRRLRDIITANFVDSHRDSWLSDVRKHGLERVMLQGDMFYMCENPAESLIDRIHRGFAERPDQEFYIVDDPTRETFDTYFLLSGDDALKILAMGFLP